MKMFDNIAIAGLGLLGGSVALAARKNNLVSEIFGYTRTPETLEKAKNSGIVDRGFLCFSEMVKVADFLVLAAPISINIELAKSIAKIKPNILFTDVGSTKKSIADAVEKHFKRKHRFAGSHPMAGSEKRGIEQADGDLFKEKTVIITPVRNAEKNTVEKIDEFWRNTGASTVTMDADQHDEICALTSHLPHLVAFLLVEMISKEIHSSEVFACIGSGFRDTTRIAASDQEIWTDIFISNKHNILKSIKNFRTSLENVEKMIKAKDTDALKKWIGEIKEIRQRI